MLRIIAGKYRGRKLKEIKSKDIRPTQAKVKKSMLEILEPFSDKEVLDLFSGSGALGIEALSRGAKKVISIDNNRENHNNLTSNFQNICKDDDYEIKCLNAMRYLRANSNMYDIVMCDPPYYKFDHKLIFTLCKPLIKKGGIFCMEMEKKIVDENIFRVKIYGRLQVIIWRNDE